MKYYIQAKGNDFVTIFIDMIDFCSDSELKRQTRNAFITKSPVSLYLGGKVLKTEQGFDFSQINTVQFYNTGIDLNKWIEKFNNLTKHLFSKKNAN